MKLAVLVRMTPMQEETKKELLAKLDKLNIDQQLEIARICWSTLSKLRQVHYAKTTDTILEEVRQEKRPYNINDFTEVEAKLQWDFKKSKESAETEEELGQVRKGLKTHLSKPASKPIPPPS